MVCLSWKTWLQIGPLLHLFVQQFGAQSYGVSTAIEVKLLNIRT